MNIASGFNVAYYYCNGQQEFSVSDGNDELTDASYANLTEMSSRYHKEAWNLVNEGPGSYQVYTSEKPRSTVRVGELVALQAEHMNDDEWIIAAVRWLMVQADGSYKIGIQAMNRDLQIGAVRALSGETMDTEYCRAVLLGRSSNDSDFTIVTTRQLYEERRPLEQSGRQPHPGDRQGALGIDDRLRGFEL